MVNVIAFDVSMKKSYMVYYADSECEFEQEINHNQIDFGMLKIFIETIIDRCGEQPSIVFEATGHYSRPLERFMQNNQFKYCLLNPLEAKKQCDGLRNHKTDRADAHRLAQTHGAFNRKNKIESDQKYLELRSLSRFYEELTEDLVIAKNKLHSLLQLTFPEIESVFTSKDSELCLNIIECFPHPDLILGQSRTVLKNKLLSNTNKNLSPTRALKQAEKLLNLAHNSYPAVREDDPICDQVVYYVRKIRSIKQEHEHILSQMIVLAEILPEYDILCGIPGIGPLTAIRFIAEVGDIKRFPTNKQLNAFAGIDVRHYQSGKTTYKDSLNKRGNRYLRKLLYLMVMNMIRGQKHCQNHIIDYYYKLKTQPYNKCHKVAVVACMNKLLKVIHYLLITNQHYDLSLTA